MKGRIIGAGPGGSSSSGGGGTPDDNTVTSAKIVDGAIVDADINGAAAIALSKLATNPLARANHTGTQVMATISDAGALAVLSAIASAQITDGTIVNADINAAAAIAATKVVQSIGPDVAPANAGIYQHTTAVYGGQFVGITALKPIFIPINLYGVTAMSVTALRMSVSALFAGSTVGAALYSVTYPSSAHVSASLVAQLNAAMSGAANGTLKPALTTGAAGSGAGTLAADFTANRYLVGVMASDLSTLKLRGYTVAAADTNLGILSWTAAARSGTTDWPSTFDETSAVAISATTTFPNIDLLTATGAFYL